MSMAAPYELFATLDGWVFIAAANDRLFGQVCKALDLTELIADARFSVNPARVLNRAELHRLMEAKTLALPAATVVDKLQAFGAPCSVMNNVSQMLDDEQVASVRIVQPLPIDQDDGHRVVGVPFTLNGHRMDQHVAPPALGEHTERLLAEAGYSAGAIEALHARRVVG